ncbi:competence protein ComJ [Brevundimonas sp.]|uniref:competence protein ComJ n=1 Tax=Brevundimonas sp. TaxID=1871086 RepID=UPI001A2D5099|nr:competence protein ComJ [Brevundimonas sp.]MBJ7484863.1 hypothetical protein [Brevundimonas sp.]
MKSFDLAINYAQVSVFDAGLDLPYNDWTPAHVQQGFSWRPGSVSFALPAVDAVHVEIRLATSRVSPQSNAKRAVVVPIEKRSTDLIVGSIMSAQHQIELSEGRYGLLFEATDDIPANVALTFFPSSEDAFAVLIASDEMNPDAAIVREAESA